MSFWNTFNFNIILALRKVGIEYINITCKNACSENNEVPTWTELGLDYFLWRIKSDLALKVDLYLIRNPDPACFNPPQSVLG